MAICSLGFWFIFAATLYPLALIPLDRPSADFRFPYSRLAHQSASSLSLFNFGISGVFLFIAFTLPALFS
jgi:hypothetical protein